MPGPLTLGVGAPILFPQWKCSPSPTPYSSEAFSGPWRGEPLHSPSRDLPRAGTDPPPTGSQVMLAQGPGLCSPVPAPQERQTVQAPTPWGAGPRFPQRASSIVPSYFSRFSLREKNVRNALREKVSACCQTLGSHVKVCAPQLRKSRNYCKLPNLQDTEPRPGIPAGANSSGRTKSPCLPPSHPPPLPEACDSNHSPNSHKERSLGKGSRSTDRVVSGRQSERD